MSKGLSDSDEDSGDESSTGGHCESVSSVSIVSYSSDMARRKESLCPVSLGNVNVTDSGVSGGKDTSEEEIEENGDGRPQKKLAAMWQMVCATRSQTLERKGSSEIGLLLFGYWGYFSCFPGQRKCINSKVMLTIDVNDGRIAGKQSLSTWIEILSVPGALPFVIDVTIFLLVRTSLR